MFQATDFIFHKNKIKSYISLLFLDSWIFTTYSIIIRIIIIVVFIIMDITKFFNQKKEIT